MAALWLVVLVGVTGYELSVRSRSGRLAVANSLEQTQAEAAADGALETVRGQLAMRLAQPLDARPRTGPESDPWFDLALVETDTLVFGDARALPRLYDAGARIQLNRASEADLRRFLVALPVDAGLADRLAQRIHDWRDRDNFRRARGSERDDYLRAGARRLPRNADFARVDELRDVDGMTPERYAQVAPHLTLLGTGQININTAPRPVLLSMPGMTEEAVAAVIRARQARRPIRTIEELTSQLSPGARSSLVAVMFELSQRAAFETREVVVEAQGWVDGSPVHVTAEALLARGGDAMFTIGRRVVQ